MLRHQLSISHIPDTPDRLFIQDTSIYNNFAEYPRLALHRPGSSSPINLPFRIGELNVYTKPQLKNYIPDGVYQATYSVAPHDEVFVCYTFLKTASFRCDMHKWMNSIDWINEPVDSLVYQKLTKINGLLLGAEAIVKQDAKKATEYFKQASLLLSLQ